MAQRLVKKFHAKMADCSLDPETPTPTRSKKVFRWMAA
jgi:hypothetical protein